MPRVGFVKIAVGPPYFASKRLFYRLCTYLIMSSTSNVSLSYRDAGVDIDAGDALVEAIKPFAKRTMREGVLGGIGGFGGVFVSNKKEKENGLVFGIDGVGTQLKLALALKRPPTVGNQLAGLKIR